MWSMHKIKINAVMYEQLVVYVKKNFTKAINDMIKDKCIENNDEEQENCYKEILNIKSLHS